LLKNYIRSSLKNLLKNKIITFINVIGLSIGITGLFLVFVFTNHEMSYDTFYPNHERIFRVCQKEMSLGNESISEATAPPLALEIESTIPDIESTCRYLEMSSRLVAGPNHTAYEDHYRYVDPSFFSMFSIPVLQGQPMEVIDNPDNIVVTRRIAERYFGTTDIIGQTLTIRDKDFTVGAVIENPPSYSYLQYDILRTIYTIDDPAFHNSAWLWHAIETFVKLRPEANIILVQEKVKYLSNEQAIQQFKDSGLDYTFLLQPISMISKQRLTDSGIVVSSSARNIVIFRFLGIFVLFLACLNFINLTIALYFKRAKEVGIRKVLGAGKSQLVHQFLIESMITVILSILVSVVAIELVLPSFLNFTGIPTLYLSELPIAQIVFFTILILSAGIAASIYPAIYASSRTTSHSLGQKKVQFTNKILRPGLIIMQFAISIVIIIVMLSMKQQVAYMQNKDLGYDANHKLVLTMRRETEFPDKYETYKDIFVAIPGVQGVTASGQLPGRNYPSFSIESENNGDKVQTTMYCFSIDQDFLPQYDIHVIEGRNFDQVIDTEPDRVFMMSESGIKHMGWNSVQEAIGQEIVTGHGGRTGKIIGIFKDFNYESLHVEIEPLFFEFFSGYFQYLTLNIQSNNLSQVINEINNVWQKNFPHIPIEYFFADEAFNEKYQNEMKAITLMRSFSILAIFIACSGLIGISLFIFQLRTKEIGIRKVLGASVTTLIKLLNKNFLLWVIIANVIAWPVSYNIIQKWLLNFAYRSSINPLIFLLSGVITILLSLIVLSFQTLRTAHTNPSEVIKYE